MGLHPLCNMAEIVRYPAVVDVIHRFGDATINVAALVPAKEGSTFYSNVFICMIYLYLR